MSSSNQERRPSLSSLRLGVAVSASLRPRVCFSNALTDCKTLAPIYDELAQGFQYANKKVVIAKVDADQHKDLGQRFGVQGFPTLKWFDGKSETPVDYSKGRDLDSLTSFITEKTGVKPRSNKAPSKVTMLTDKLFNETIGKEQNVLVAFTAPWCGREYPPFSITTR